MMGEAHTHYSRKLFSDSQKTIEVFAPVLDWLWENGRQPIFMPMDTVEPDDNRIISNLVMERAECGGDVFLFDEEIFPRDVPNLYEYCQAAFVARVHGSVTALLDRCPMIMYAFDLKHGGIMDQMRLSGQIFHPETDLPERSYDDGGGSAFSHGINRSNEGKGRGIAGAGESHERSGFTSSGWQIARYN